MWYRLRLHTLPQPHHIAHTNSNTHHIPPQAHSIQHIPTHAHHTPHTTYQLKHTPLAAAAHTHTNIHTTHLHSLHTPFIHSIINKLLVLYKNTVFTSHSYKYNTIISFHNQNKSFSRHQNFSRFLSHQYR